MHVPAFGCLPACKRYPFTAISRVRKHASDAREQYDALERCSLQQQLPEQDRTRVSASPLQPG